MEPMQLQSSVSNIYNSSSSKEGSVKSSASLSKILTAIVDGHSHDSHKEGLIRAFREQQSSMPSTTSSLSSATSGFYSAEPQSPLATSSSTQMSPGTPQVPEVPKSNLVPAARSPQPDSTSTTSKPRTVAATPDVIPVSAYRMLTVAPSLPQAMQRSQWTSYDYHILEKLYTGYASKGEQCVCCCFDCAQLQLVSSSSDAYNQLQ